ncbi:hypothetical protein TSUD_360650 [Trifolium subterraneum]|uniref:Uncharacterized protein n=1 Tax=Trifolium subterraneum TaxID=3900 RepID=A0A2Z6N1L1_TRISU|nr:hypothetical protein TSUD_360650 [Trifolium subterraneum]
MPLAQHGKSVGSMMMQILWSLMLMEAEAPSQIQEIRLWRFVVRNYKGSFQFPIYGNFGIYNVFHAEIQALIVDIKLSWQAGGGCGGRCASREEMEPPLKLQITSAQGGDIFIDERGEITTEWRTP